MSVLVLFWTVETCCLFSMMDHQMVTQMRSRRWRFQMETPFCFSCTFSQCNDSFPSLFVTLTFSSCRLNAYSTLYDWLMRSNFFTIRSTVAFKAFAVSIPSGMTEATGEKGGCYWMSSCRWWLREGKCGNWAFIKSYLCHPRRDLRSCATPLISSTCWSLQVLDGDSPALLQSLSLALGALAFGRRRPLCIGRHALSTFFSMHLEKRA